MFGNFVSDNWKNLILDDYIPWNLKRTPLQIKTSSPLNTDKLIGVGLMAEEGAYFGGICIKFGHTAIQYWLDGCTTELLNDSPPPGTYRDLPVQPPSEVDKIWTFNVTESAVVINCNGVEVLNYNLSRSSYDSCVDWTLDSSKLQICLVCYKLQHGV